MGHRVRPEEFPITEPININDIEWRAWAWSCGDDIALKVPVMLVKSSQGKQLYTYEKRVAKD